MKMQPVNLLQTLAFSSALLLLGLSTAPLAVAQSTSASSTCNPQLQCCATPGTGNPCAAGVGNPINTQTGNKFQREVDMPALPGVLGLELIRYYNSNASGVYGTRGLFGRGWKLSYEAQATYERGGVRLEQADGTVRFYRQMEATSKLGKLEKVYRTGLAEHGQLRSNADKTLVWHSAYGTQFLFNDKGQLVQIAATSGEFTTIERDGQGRLLAVIDPQGRRLGFHYLDRDQGNQGNQSNQGLAYHGIQAVDTPVGRYQYVYGTAPSKELQRSTQFDSRQLLANLSQVLIPTGIDSSAVPIVRQYHYEDARWPTLLTGISVKGKGSDGQAMHERLVTWGYDAQGRANLSVKGEPARLATDAKGQVLTPKRLADGTGIEQVTLDFSQRKADGTGATLLTNSLGQLTKYEYGKVNGGIELVAVTGAGCATCGPVNVRYSYGKQGKQVLAGLSTLKGKTDSALEYDAVGRPAREGTTRYEYADDWSLQPTKMTSPSVVPGKQMEVSISYNAYGQMTQVTQSGYSPIDNVQPITRTTRYTYELINNRSVLTKIDGPLANGAKGDPTDSDVTLLTYDNLAQRVATVITPGSIKTTLQYDGAGRTLSQVMNDGHRQIQTSNQYANLATIANEVQSVRQNGQLLGDSKDIATLELTLLQASFDATGKRTRSIDSAGRTINQHYDQAGRTIGTSDAQGFKTQQYLNTEGQVQMAGLFLSGQTQPHRAAYFWHDEVGRLTQRLLPDGRMDTWQYTQAGQLQQHMDGLGTRTTFLRSAEKAVQISQSADGWVHGGIKRRTLPISSRTSTRVDDFGRVIEKHLADHGTKLASFNSAHQLMSLANVDGTKVWYEWDYAGRLTTKRYSDARGKDAGKTTLAYQGNLLIRATDPNQASQYEFDALGRLVSETITLTGLTKPIVTRTGYSTDTGLVSAKVLADGRLLRHHRTDATRGAQVESLTLQKPWVARLYSSFEGTVLHDLAKPMLKVFADQVIAQNIKVDAFDGLKQWTSGNGILSEKRFDIAGRLTQFKVDKVSTLQYDYEVGPRITAIRDASTSNTPFKKATYAYEGFGMLQADGAPTLVKANTPALTLGLTTNKNRTQFDDLGRTISDERFKYSYTIAGQVEAVSDLKGKAIAQYAYNSLQQRVRKTVFTVDGVDSVDNQKARTTYYVWHQGKLAAEVSSEGRIDAQYLYLNEGNRAMPIAKLEESDTYFIHTDHRATPTAMTDKAQQVVWQADMSPWGVTNTSNKKVSANAHQTSLNIRMLGQYFDAETGLHDNWHRTYNPTTGSYLSPDPLGYHDGPNPYLYAGGDPINKADPTGLFEIDMHYYMTFFLGLSAGMDYKQARTTALAAQFVDDNPITRPLDDSNLLTILGSVFRNHQQLLFYHFTLSESAGLDTPGPSNDGRTLAQYANDDVNSVVNNLSPQLQNLIGASERAPTDCAKYQFLGEFIHAYADTFSHRDAYNDPYDAFNFLGLGTGHGLAAGSEPDYTFALGKPNGDPLIDARNWLVRPDRTLAAEKAIFNKLTEYGGGKGVSWETISGTLEAFNAIQQKGSDATVGQKKQLLENKLNEMLNNLEITPVENSVIMTRQINLNSATVDGYNESTAQKNRDKFLIGLKESDYPGVCLPGGSRCKPV
jgi:RHS repeat-associated protein